MLRTLFAVSAILLNLSVAAAAEPVRTRDLPVKVRDSTGKLRVESRTLPNLLSDTALIGTHFVIHQADSDRPVTIDASTPGQLALAAATAYYHLEEAFRHLDERSKQVAPLAAMAAKMEYPYVVRVEMNLPFSEDSHFVRDGTTGANNSLTVPGGEGVPAMDGFPEIPAWNPEIWFYQSKPERYPSPVHQIARVMNSRVIKNALFTELTYADLSDIGISIASGTRPFWEGHALSIGTTIAFTELLLPVLSWITSPFESKREIDTALVPEAVYHEFSHLVFKPHLDIFRPTAVVEGFPNYFAHRVSGLKNLGAKTGQVSKGYAPKKGDSKERYNGSQELGLAAATGGFLHSVLYQLSQEFGEEADLIIYGAIEELNRSSDIRHDFTGAILKSIRRHSRAPALQAIRAQTVFGRKGL